MSSDLRKYITLVENAQRENTSFNSWFGNSQVVDAKGRPLVVFHGSPNGDIHAFDQSKDGGNTGAASHEHALGGFYFSTDPDIADTYARTHEVTFADVAQQEFGIEHSDLPKSSIYPVFLSIENPLRVAGGAITKDVLVRAHANGCDGIIKSGAYPEYVVFDPSQIKSAIGNNGNFDRNDPRITEQRMGGAGLCCGVPFEPHRRRLPPARAW